MPSHPAKTHGSHKKKTKSRKQVRFLLSKVSPLQNKQKAKLKKELKTGKVKVRKK